MVGEHNRYRSWEHCYRYFRNAALTSLKTDRDHAALQLGFYLASWGMYRGSSFLLQYTYTAHLGVIDELLSPRFSSLWKDEFGPTESGIKLLPVVVEAINAIREAYRPFAPTSEARQASDTLVTQILLGTFGCLPACDRYFIDGFKSEGLKYSYLNTAFIERVLHFCAQHISELRAEQDAIEQSGGLRYPLMKLVDMYFWQIGYELDQGKSETPDIVVPSQL
jgi:hypothetical protein